MNIINQSDIIKALQKNSRFDSLLHQCDTFLGIGEGVSAVLDHFSKECEGNEFLVSEQIVRLQIFFAYLLVLKLQA